MGPHKLQMELQLLKLHYADPGPYLMTGRGPSCKEFLGNIRHPPGLKSIKLHLAFPKLDNASGLIWKSPRTKIQDIDVHIIYK